MIKAVVFDVDGTLYDETYPKVKAELLTAEFISDKSCVNVEDVYNTFREVKPKSPVNMGEDRKETTGGSGMKRH